MVPLSRTSCLGTSVPPLSNRAKAARNKNLTVCEACRRRHQKCDRGPKTEWRCSFCRLKGAECIRKDDGRVVTDNHIQFVQEYNIPAGQLIHCNGHHSIDVPALACSSPSVSQTIVTQTNGDAAHDPRIESVDLDSWFSPLETLYRTEPAEKDISDNTLNKLRAETPWEAELKFLDTNKIIEEDLIQAWIQRASQKTSDFVGVDGQHVPHLGFVFRVEKGRYNGRVVWYTFEGLIFVARCDNKFAVLEGPFWYVS